MSEEEKKAYEEAKLYLEHTGVDDFNLEKHQCENRKWAIETILKIVDKQQKENKELKQITLLYNSYKVPSEERKIVIADSEYFIKGFFKEHFISKDKIRELIENNEEDISYSLHDMIEDLKKLLEE